LLKFQDTHGHQRFLATTFAFGETKRTSTFYCGKPRPLINHLLAHRTQYTLHIHITHLHIFRGRRNWASSYYIPPQVRSGRQHETVNCRRRSIQNAHVQTSSGRGSMLHMHDLHRHTNTLLSASDYRIADSSIQSNNNNLGRSNTQPDVPRIPPPPRPP